MGDHHIDHHIDGSRRRRHAALGLVAWTLALTPALATRAEAATPVPLGTADSFALLAGSMIANKEP